MNKYILPTLFATCAISQSAIIAGVTASADSTFAGGGGLNATQLVNGSNLSGLTADEATLTTATHGEDSGSLNQWHTTVGTTGNTNVTFALGGTTTIGSIWIWNHNQPTVLTRGVNQFDILTSTDGTNFTEVQTDNTLAVSSGGSITAQGFDLAAANITHVRIHIDSNHGDVNVVGLAEVRFSDNDVATVTGVPEPSSTALLGLGGLALILRRRK